MLESYRELLTEPNSSSGRLRGTQGKLQHGTATRKAERAHHQINSSVNRVDMSRQIANDNGHAINMRM